eukprot:TRINITY_DN34330_c0_g1_i1.p1 TRINITY_DN34330_c0_g1~~TRINITY_DN34330_c0_g1_i1.p1  ORF type:complete len:272 (-),score=70.54 TRINITY_DN34330_c0_g1_i1:57-842(-)
MGSSLSSERTSLLGACTPGAGSSTPGGAQLISVIRSGAWGMGEEEDTWPVEVPAGSTVQKLKETIEELYDVPQPLQKLCLTADPSSEAVDDSMHVEALQRRIYLHPNEGVMEPGQAEAEAMAEVMMASIQETVETSRAVEESLQGVMYTVHFQRPAEAGGEAAGKTVTLTLEALARASDVCQLVEAELFGRAGAEPAYLMFESQHLDPDMPLYYAGIEDGKTVQVVRDPPPEIPGDPMQLLMAMAQEDASIGVAPRALEGP